MFEIIKEALGLKETVKDNIDRIRSEQSQRKSNFEKEWNKWNQKTQIKRK